MQTTKIIAALALGISAVAGTAQAYTGRVKSACKSDFYKFCPSYKPDTPELRSCMRSAGGNISGRCLDALADAGEIPRKYHSSQRGKK
jgi:hypothetical protein